MNAVRLPHGVAWALELPGQVSGGPGGRGCAPELCIHRSVASASHPGPARVWGLGGNAQDCDPGPPAPQQQASRDRGRRRNHKQHSKQEQWPTSVTRSNELDL